MRFLDLHLFQRQQETQLPLGIVPGVMEMRAVLTEGGDEVGDPRLIEAIEAGNPGRVRVDKRMQREGENPVPHYWSHVHWVFGARDQADFLELSRDMNMNGHMERIKVPFLVTHGTQDRQISVDYAHQAFAQLTNSARPELRIFTAREGGRACRRRQYELRQRLHRRLVRRHAGRADEGLSS